MAKPVHNYHFVTQTHNQETTQWKTFGVIIASEIHLQLIVSR